MEKSFWISVIEQSTCHNACKLYQLDKPPLSTPSQRPSHLEILRLLDSNPPNTIMVFVIGPLTDLALAASVSPNTLMRAKSIVIMGGALSGPGNITPLAEFNFYADPIAAARLFALTSRDPSSTMPLSPLGSLSPTILSPYPPKRSLVRNSYRSYFFPWPGPTTFHTPRRLWSKGKATDWEWLSSCRMDEFIREPNFR